LNRCTARFGRDNFDAGGETDETWASAARSHPNDPPANPHSAKTGASDDPHDLRGGAVRL
jgi:hypothetical protein